MRRSYTHAPAPEHAASPWWVVYTGYDPASTTFYTRIIDAYDTYEEAFQRSSPIEDVEPNLHHPDHREDTAQ